MSRVNETPCFKSLKPLLKVLKLSGGDHKPIDQVVVKYIIQKSPFLEKYIVDTCDPWYWRRF